MHMLQSIWINTSVSVWFHIIVTNTSFMSKMRNAVWVCQPRLIKNCFVIDYFFKFEAIFLWLYERSNTLFHTDARGNLVVHFMEKWYNSSRSNPNFVPRDLTNHSLSSKGFYYFHLLHNLQRHWIFSFCFKGKFCFPFVFVIFSFSLALCIGLLSYFICPSNRLLALGGGRQNMDTK